MTLPLEDRTARYERILALREEGLTYSAIAKTLGLTKQRVQRIEAAGPPRPYGRPPVTDKMSQG